MRKITMSEASKILQISEQAVRVMIQKNKIPGAICYGPEHRRTYYITDVQLENFMRGIKE